MTVYYDGEHSDIFEKTSLTEFCWDCGKSYMYIVAGNQYILQKLPEICYQFRAIVARDALPGRLAYNAAHANNKMN